jgi:hypothetical protein
MRKLSFVAVAILLSALGANAGTILINFETVPVIATGPSLFASAGPMQAITVPGVATFTGGVVLGNAANLPAQAFTTPPNSYGTANSIGAGPGLLSTLTIALDSAFGTVNEVSFPILNGSTINETYIVDAFNGATLVASQTFPNVPSNLNSGFAIADIMSPSITSVTISPLSLDASCCGGWDFFIDSVALNSSVQQAFAPEPASLVLIGLALALACILKLLARI